MLPDMSRTEIEYLVNEWIHHKRNREILLKRLLDGVCYEPLAEEFDMSVRQVKTIVRTGTYHILLHREK